MDRKAAGGGAGAWTLISHTVQPNSSADVTVTTPAINCTGANLYVIETMSYMTIPSAPRYNPGDGGHDFPPGNTSGWAHGSVGMNTGMFWMENVVGAPSVAFSAHIDYGPVFASCWAGSATSSAKDQESASGLVSCFPCSPGLTPTADGTLILMDTISETTGATFSSSGFTLFDSIPGAAVLYKVLGSGTNGVAQSATVTSSPTDTGGVKMVNFKHP